VVSRRGEAHVDALGTTALGGDRKVQADTIFRISSMTKPVTAVATLILLEECELRLDESVERLLPELADRRVVRRIDGPIDDTVPANRRSLFAICLRFAWASVGTSGTAR
jgi:CubicO group peptidase (beta-lactamase class C family)